MCQGCQGSQEPEHSEDCRPGWGQKPVWSASCLCPTIQPLVSISRVKYPRQSMDVQRNTLQSETDIDMQQRERISSDEGAMKP